MKISLVSLLISLLAFNMLAAEPRRLYLANDDHTDYMWLADEATYDRVFQEQIDFNLRLTARTMENPAPFQHRFNLDGSYWLWAYEKNRTPQEFARVIAALKSGHLSAPLNALVSCYGGQPVEAVLRGMYYAGRLERKYDLRFTQATAMENRTLPLGLASLWAGSGAKYSWRGQCESASRIPSKERDHEIYWATGLDGQRVLMKWHTWIGFYTSGGYAEAFDPRKAVEYLDADPKFLSRYHPPGTTEPYSIRAAFGFGWDALDRKTGEPYHADPKTYPVSEHFHDVAKATTTTERQVIVSNQEDFFRDFEAKYGEQLPADALAYGNQWDLYSASMAETSSRVRRAVESLRTAEALATVVSLRRPGFMSGRETARDRAFVALGLYWEHDWTADGAVHREDRAKWQERLASEIESYVSRLQSDATAALGELIPKADGAVEFYAFNPLGWTRTDAADFPYTGPKDIHVIDRATGRDVPHQFEQREDRTILRILAGEVPALGYKIYAVVPGPGGAPTDLAARVSGPKNRDFQNSRVRLTLEDDGGIAGLYDLASPDYNLAGRIDNLVLNDLSSTRPYRNAAFQVEQSGPVSVTLRCATDTGRNHTTRVTLVRDSDRVEIRNEITEAMGDLKHWTFSFNLPSPNLRTEEVGAIIRVKTKSAGGDYAEKNARYDYATLNHFADMTDGTDKRGVTLSNWDCAFAKFGHSTPTKLDTDTAQLSVLAGGQVDGEGFGIRNQNGATYFLHRFALRAHAGYDQVAAMKFALEHQNPLVTGALAGSSDAPFPAQQFSLLGVSAPDVLVWAVKPAEEGIEQGIMARLWNLADAPREASVTLNPRLASASRTTHLETDLAVAPLNAAGGLTAQFARQQLQTFRLRPAEAPFKRGGL